MTQTEIDQKNGALTALRKRALEQAKAIIDKAMAQKRGLSVAEHDEVEELHEEVERLNEERLKVSTGPPPVDLPAGCWPRSGDRPGGDDPSWRRRDGTEVRAIGPEERLADHVGASDVLPDGIRASELSLGRMVRAMATGDWRDARAEARALGEGAVGTGGVFVPTPLSMQVIDLARNQARVIRAGARTIPMDAETLKVARIATDPTPAWKAENAEGVDSEGTFEPVTFTARTLFCNTKASVELIMDAENAEQVIRNQLSEALALELDRVALRGSGTPPEPEGILNQTGVTIDEQGSADGEVLLNYHPLSVAAETIATSNLEANAAIYSARTAGTMDRFAGGDFQPLRPPPSVERMLKLSTNQIPNDETVGSSTDCSEIYVGDFTKLWIGMRERLQVEVSTQAADSSSSAFRNLQVWIRAWLRADVALAQPSGFVVLTGVRA